MLPLQHSTRTVILVLVLLPLTSCSGDRTAGPPGEGELGAACVQNADCDTGWCLQEKSFPDNYCSKECAADPNICPAGSVCRDYAGYKFCLRSCGGDGDCRQGYVCDYDICLPPCGADKFCNNGDACLAGRCKAKCTSNEECPGDLRCQDGKCVPPCKTDGDCLPGYACDKGAGSCKAKPGKPMGQACGSDKECATGFCLPDRHICSIRCTSHSACPSAYSCGLETYDKDYNGTKDSALAGCVPVKGSNIAGELCGKDADCASEHCYNGFCLEGCAADGDCRDGSFQCVTVNILLKGGIPQYNGCLPRTGVSDFTLGTFNDGGTSYHGLDIPPTAASFIIVTQVQSITEVGLVSRLTDPVGNVLYDSYQIDQCSYYSAPLRYAYDEQYSSMFVPNTPAVKLVSGMHTYAVGATAAGLPVTVRVKLKLGLAQKGTVGINWYFLNLANHACLSGPTLNAASAPSHSWLGKIRNNLGTILHSMGLTIGAETYQDLNKPALDVIELPLTGTGTELQQLFASSQGKQGSAINVFLTRDIKAGGMSGGIILGIAGGIPGPSGDHGTVHSGVAMSMQTACFEFMGYNPAHTLAHEMGHYLGLSHNVENETPGLVDGQVVCACPCGANLSCVTPSTGGQYCRGMDPIPDTTTSADNLMYWAAESTQLFKGNQLTPGQIRVILDNPVVGHK